MHIAISPTTINTCAVFDFSKPQMNKVEAFALKLSPVKRVNIWVACVLCVCARWTNWTPSFWAFISLNRSTTKTIQRQFPLFPHSCVSPYFHQFSHNSAGKHRNFHFSYCFWVKKFLFNLIMNIQFFGEKEPSKLSKKLLIGWMMVWFYLYYTNGNASSGEMHEQQQQRRQQQCNRPKTAKEK